MHPEHIVRLLINEAFLSRKLVVALFCSVVLMMLGAGLALPKGYKASTTILVDERNIIQPLMQGTAVTTEVTDRSRMAREIMFGRKIMDQIAADAGMLRDDATPSQREDATKSLIKETAISNVGPNLIKIEYRNPDPERAFLVTKRYADLFIAESLNAKAAESKAAFDFIDKQVQEYHDKLTTSEGELKDFRSSNLDAQPGADADVGSRLSALQTRIDQSTDELRETEIKKKSLEKQLSGEAETANVISREGQYRSRIAELQGEIDTLRLTYLDSYPDIVHLRHQIEDLNQAIVAERQKRETAKASGRVIIDDSIINNPMYQQIKRDLSQTQVQIDMLNARISESRRQLAHELERGKRVHGGEATLAELTRDYQVNRDIYQDLLRRRENARVSMNIDRDNQGLTFKIQEPATLPTQPSGLLFIHFLILGLVGGVLAPLGLLYAKIQVDPRIRLSGAIADRHKIEVLASVPHLSSPAEVATVHADIFRLALAVGGTLSVVMFVLMLRMLKVV